MIEIAIDWKGLYQAFQSSASEYRCFLSLDSGEVLRLRNGDAGMEAIDRAPSRFVAIEIVPRGSSTNGSANSSTRLSTSPSRFA